MVFAPAQMLSFFFFFFVRWDGRWDDSGMVGHWWPPESVQRHFEGLFFKASSLKDGGPMIMSTSLGRDEFDNHSIIDRLTQTVEF